MSGPSVAASESPTTTNPTAMVDPRAPRFGQGITALGLAAGIGLQRPAFVYAITAVLVIAALSKWRLDPYGIIWKQLHAVVGAPADREAAAPHRFSKLLAAIFTSVASGCLIIAGAGGIGWMSVVGYGVATAVVGLAVASSVFDYCVGCKMYRQVAFFRRLNWI
ncbi:DUF4395 domain-containing protein [Halonotius terrestris]|uniref:DUF4395 domain-containing protein n=1 Tax=Halonotius terrestris TaxID=2487750 RepID=A0A8J8TDG0_9EURY|nr:DUF4395 domain-containing protein [Halonotius terrestris]TQQ83486.1 DUF4395 domain-containing protein [Halonotius terrestris]